MIGALPIAANGDAPNSKGGTGVPIPNQLQGDYHTI
jgi:hypothetical protein